MGDYILCRKPKKPSAWMIECLSVNVFSIEELCYCVIQNPYLLDNSFMEEGLVDWIRNCLGLTEIADTLSQKLGGRAGLTDFTETLLSLSGYATAAEEEAVKKALMQMASKSDFEIGKLRADLLLKNGRYSAAAIAFQALLDRKEAGEQTKELLGEIWNHLGIAYAKLFLFQDSIRCFRESYMKMPNEKALQDLLTTCLLAGNEEQYIKLTGLYHVGSLEKEKIRERYQSALDEAAKEAGTDRDPDTEIASFEAAYRRMSRT